MGHCPGETGSLLWLSFSLRSRPETGFVAICIVLQTKNCDVLPHIMHTVTFTSPHRIHIFVEMCVCVYVHCTFGHDRDQTCSTKFLKFYTRVRTQYSYTCTSSVMPKITGKAHEKTPPNICPSTRVLSPSILYNWSLSTTFTCL